MSSRPSTGVIQICPQMMHWSRAEQNSESSSGMSTFQLPGAAEAIPQAWAAQRQAVSSDDSGQAIDDNHSGQDHLFHLHVHVVWPQGA